MTRTRHAGRHVQTTLLELVSAIAEVATSDAEVIAVVDHLLASGRLKLRGQFTERDFGVVA